jgi:hypothetical protein
MYTAGRHTHLLCTPARSTNTPSFCGEKRERGPLGTGPLGRLWGKRCASRSRLAARACQDRYQRRPCYSFTATHIHIEQVTGFIAAVHSTIGNCRFSGDHNQPALEQFPRRCQWTGTLSLFGQTPPRLPPPATTTTAATAAQRPEQKANTPRSTSRRETWIEVCIPV